MDEKAIQDMTKYKNVSSFQFVDTVNSLLAGKFKRNCEKFSLRDKAHIKQMIRDIESKLKSNKKEFQKCQKESKEVIDHEEKLQKKIDQNSILAAKVQKMQEANAQIDQIQKQFETGSLKMREELAKLKSEHKKLVEIREHREQLVVSKYTRVLEMMQTTIKGLKGDISRLKMFEKSQLFSLKIGDRAEEQDLIAQISEVERRDQEMDQKIRDVKAESAEFINSLQARYRKVKLEWEESALVKERLGRELEELEEEEKFVEEEIKELERECVGLKQSLRMKEIEYGKVDRMMRMNALSSTQRTQDFAALVSISIHIVNFHQFSPIFPETSQGCKTKIFRDEIVF